MRGDLLAEPVDGLDEALAAVDAVDRVLVAGLLRPQPAQVADLALIAESVEGTPLAGRVAEAADKAAAGTAGPEHTVALAAARIALLGAVHDAVTARVAAATGTVAAGERLPPTRAEVEPVNLLEAACTWLADLARSGWQGIDADLVAGAAPVVAAMLPDVTHRRLATLLDGFAAELAASCPGSALSRIPARRWADLWSRAMLLTRPGAAAVPATGVVSGRLLPLGVDLQEHPTAVQAQVHAVLEPVDGGEPRLVRASVSTPKPETVVGAGVWQLLRPHLSLLGAAGAGRSVEITDMPITAEGDLIWQDANARPGAAADPFVTARVVLPTATTVEVAPLDRHPARIAVPVFLDGYTIDDGATGGAPDDAPTVSFVVAGQPIRVDVDRIPSASPLTSEAVAASTACIALLRWDAGSFVLQPLAVETAVKRKTVAVHADAWAAGTTDKVGAKAEKAATAAVEALRERAGKLLRA
ncbi:hypothetical protein [Rhodococcus gannanensis]|uniref:Uncharacterized protein n=1 Tax=Rhodococcus gannanensis TaxID=1960308 RepID=A0ABW4P2F1_9NOCA